jgi:hypothetical protein
MADEFLRGTLGGSAEAHFIGTISGAFAKLFPGGWRQGWGKRHR